MIDRLLPTLFLVGCGFILCLLCVAVYVAVAAVDDRRAARDAERSARPHSARVGTAGQDAAAILRARIREEQPGCALPDFMACDCDHVTGCQHPAAREEQR